MSIFWKVEKKLADAVVKYTALAERRSKALREAVRGKDRKELMNTITGGDRADRVLMRLQNCLRSEPNCVPLHLAVVLEKLLNLEEGTLYIVLYHTEQENYAVLKREYGLLASPRVVKRDEPIDVKKVDLSEDELRMEARRAALHRAMQKTGFKTASSVAIAVYPNYLKDKEVKKRYKALYNRLSLVMKGTRELTEADAIEVSSTLLVTTAELLHPQSATPPRPPEGAKLREEQQPPKKEKSAPLPGDPLKVQVAVPQLGIDVEHLFGDYDLGTRSFVAESPKESLVGLRRVGTNCYIDVQVTILVPATHIDALVARVIPAT